MRIDSTLPLGDGNRIPRLGLGVFQMDNGEACVNAVRAALEAGYRHIDTALVYGNEEAVGEAVRGSEVPREDIFVTSKIPPSRFGREKARETVEESLRRLGFDYIDLHLIHWPVRSEMAATWDELRRQRDAGKLRSVGVSNFTEARFERQFFRESGETPVINQVERHPFFQENERLAYCRDKGIRIEAYSPLSQAKGMEDATLRAIASEHGKTVAQVMLRWQLQDDIVVIPKSSNPERIRENAGIFDFELSDDDMRRIRELDRGQSIISFRPEDDWF